MEQPPLPPPVDSGSIPPLRLRVESGPNAGRELNISGPARAGREPGQAIVLDDPLASRHHADIYPQGGAFYIADAHSANGTMVNGERLQAARLLNPGDVITIGNTSLRVIPAEAGRTPTPVSGRHSKPGRGLIVAAMVALVLGTVTIGALLVWFFSGKKSDTSLPINRSVERTTRGIFGSYLFLSETSGTKVAANAEIVLKFVPPGVVTLRATKPGQTLTDVGSFTLDGDRISITLPEIGKSASRADYTFDGQQLVLPILVIGDGQGRSTWRRIDSQPDPLNEAVERFYTNVGKQGRKACLESLAREVQQDPSVSAVKVHNEKLLTVTYRSGYQEFFLAPAVSKAPARRPAPTPGTDLPTGDDLRLNLNQQAPAMLNVACPAEDSYNRWGSRDRVSYHLQPVQFMAGGPPMLNPKDRFEAWLAREPEPVSHGDSPANKTALILGPFNTLPVLLPGSGNLHYKTFADGGEDLGYIAAQIRNSGYQVGEPCRDAQVTVKKLYESLKDSSWGVFYFSTHGGVLDDGGVLLGTGEQVPPDFRATPQLREKYLEKTVIAGLGRETYEKLKDSLMVGFIYDLPFISIKGTFFKVVNADFSSSLVYMSGCETAKSAPFRELLHARSFVGWQADSDMDLTGDMGQAFWRCMSRKTRSDREAMDFGICYLLGAKDYKAKIGIYGPGYDPRNLAVYRQGKTTPEKTFTGTQHLMLMTVREYAFRKKHSTEGVENLPEIVAQLYKCNEEDKGTGLGANPFCRDAFNGVKVVVSEIDEVKGELCGYGGSPARFTLVEK